MTLHLSLTLFSLHAVHGLDSITPGAFLENDKYVFGAWKNSYGDFSLGVGHKIPLAGNDLIIGASTGYKYPLTVAYRMNFKDWQVWILPPYKKSPLGISVGFRVK